MPLGPDLARPHRPTSGAKTGFQRPRGSAEEHGGAAAEVRGVSPREPGQAGTHAGEWERDINIALRVVGAVFCAPAYPSCCGFLF